MRVLLLFRGAPGCGKSTFIKNNGLEPYTLSADDLRLKYSSPVLGLDHNTRYTINLKLEKYVWDDLFKLLEFRLQNGDFTVIDATNSKTEEMNKYKKIASDYKYRIYIIDMTSIPKEVVKERNKNRIFDQYNFKYVSEDAIDKMYSRFETQKVPSGIKVIPYIYDKETNTGSCNLDQVLKYTPMIIDKDKYRKIVHIGDLHGCFTCFNTYLNLNGRPGVLEDDVLYIFTGDYIDRGIENKEMMEFILANYTKPNVIFLEGNHERWLFAYSKCIAARSKEFEINTKPQLYGLDRDEIQRFYRKLAQVVYYKYAGKEVLVTHGGLTNIDPENELIKIPTDQLIRGIGSYIDAQKADDMFNEGIIYSSKDFIQVHGHRNVEKIDIKSGPRTYNLEGQVEFGGCLRIMELNSDGTIDTVEVENTVFKEPKKEEEPIDLSVVNGDKSIAQLVQEFRDDKKYITERKFGNISSFNFNPKAFYEGKWNARTEKARGLYINTSTYKIVARGFDKFFKVNEMKETSIDSLSRKLVFPISIYVKENGYLGLLSYNEETDDLFITTKSNPDGDFAQWFREQLYSIFSEEYLTFLKNYCKDNNVTLLFEVVDKDRDPHIIEYKDNGLYLLAGVKNTLNFEQISYDDLSHLYRDIVNLCNDRETILKSFHIKDRYMIINDWADFLTFYTKSTERNFTNDATGYIEGFVIEDAEGYMIKIKTDYYNFWKKMRSIVPTVFRQGYITGTSMLYDDRSNNFYGFLRDIYQKYGRETAEKMQGWNIISLRKQYESLQKEGNNNNEN